MRIRYFTFSIVLLFHTAGIYAQNTGTTREFPPLAAHYTETLQAKNKPSTTDEWYLTRRDDQVETSRGLYSEVWQRDARGELTLTRVFHQEGLAQKRASPLTSRVCRAWHVSMSVKVRQPG
ncbi:MAG: hypothetical protein AABY83_01880, partial [Pseudomonadota bacterium]